MDGWTDSGHAVPLLPGTSTSSRGYILRDVRDVHKRKVLCGLQSGGPRTPGGRKDTPSPESSGRSEAGGQASSPGPQTPQAHSAPCGYWGRSALQAVPGGLPGGALACASMAMSVPEGAAQPTSEPSAAVLRRHFCLCARDGLPSATSRLTSRARKRSSCSCLLTAFLFSCTLNPGRRGMGRQVWGETQISLVAVVNPDRPRPLPGAGGPGLGVKS